MIAGFVDESRRFFEMLAGAMEASHGEVVVGQVKSHTGAGRDGVGFFEVEWCAAGEEGERQVIELAGATEIVHSLFEVDGGFEGTRSVGPA